MSRKRWQDMSCPDHPDYKALQPPRAKCHHCWKKWAYRVEFQRDEAVKDLRVMRAQVRGAVSTFRYFGCY
jgi:hypothetical protein